MQEIQETRVRSLNWKDPPAEEMAAHSNILAWKSPWREEPGRLQSMGLQRVRHSWTHMQLNAATDVSRQKLWAWELPTQGLCFCFFLMTKHQFCSDSKVLSFDEDIMVVLRIIAVLGPLEGDCSRALVLGSGLWNEVRWASLGGSSF